MGGIRRGWNSYIEKKTEGGDSGRGSHDPSSGLQVCQRRLKRYRVPTGKKKRDGSSALYENKKEKWMENGSTYGDPGASEGASKP